MKSRHNGPWHASIALLALACAAVGSCSRSESGETTTTPSAKVLDYRNGWYHPVRGGESVRDIARLYMRDPEIVARLNRTQPGAQPPPGTPIYVPPFHDSERLRSLLTRISANPEIVPRTGPPLHLIRAASEQERPTAGGTQSRAPSGSVMVWPVLGPVIQTYRPGPGSDFRGITISAPVGTPVRAARGGRVAYAGELRGYENVVILDHGQGLNTVYGNLRRTRVRSGQTVSVNSAIGEVGRTGDGGESGLFFQVRRAADTVNPLRYLPAAGR